MTSLCYTDEIATLFLVAIVFLVVVKDGLAWANALGGMIVLILVLLAAIKIYKKIRQRSLFKNYYYCKFVNSFVGNE